MGTLFHEVCSVVRMITCFLNGPFIVIWMCGFGLEPPLIMLSIFLISMAVNVSLILMTSAVLGVGLEAYA